jgi:XTP/dITP diphosphohydrolase
MAQEHPTDPFSIEDVARGIADKLIRRHPHVFAGVEVRDSQEVLENWEEIKKKEKGRTSPLDGVAMSQPALPLVENCCIALKNMALTLILLIRFQLMGQPMKAL